MPKGIIKFYNQAKGYGFITPAKGNDLFFHHTEWKGKVEPVQGEEVSFEIKEGKKGDMAGDIHRV